MNVNSRNRISKNIYRRTESDINKIIINHDLNNDFYNINNKSYINYFCINKLRMIFIYFIISMLAGILIFIILYKLKENKELKTFKEIKKNIIERDGYYIPMDSISEPICLTCSVKNCKKCFGNSYNNTCISCLNSSYIPIKDENNKIISCEYNLTQSLVNLCKPGFFLPEEDNMEEKQCKKCSTFGCEKCYGNKTIDYCDTCFSDYISKYINNTLFCSIELDENCINYDSITFKCFLCKNNYTLLNGRCYA